MNLKVALQNLYISQSIIITFLIFAYLYWFPYSFTNLGGFYKTAGMLIFVDLILGPLLVFFIYKENKKFLKFDINVILSIQLISFIFGAYSLFLKHPAYVVFSIDRFVLTNVSNIYPQPSWLDQAQHHFFSSPEFVVAQLPKDIKERNNLTLEVALNDKPDIDSRPKYFSPFDQNIDLIMKKSIQLEQLVLDTQEQKTLALFSKKHKSERNNFAYFPLKGNNQNDVIWVFNKYTAKPIEILDIDPWKFKVASKLKDK